MHVYLYEKFSKDITQTLLLSFYLRYNLITPIIFDILNIRCCVLYVLAFEAPSKARFFKLWLRYNFYSHYMCQTSYCIKIIIKWYFKLSFLQKNPFPCEILAIISGNNHFCLGLYFKKNGTGHKLSKSTFSSHFCIQVVFGWLTLLVFGVPTFLNIVFFLLITLQLGYSIDELADPV